MVNKQNIKGFTTSNKEDWRLNKSYSEDYKIFHLYHKLIGHSNIINEMEWSPDGRILASSSMDQTVRFWDTASGELIRKKRKGKDQVFRIAWLPDKTSHILAIHEGNIMRVWDAMSGKTLKRFSHYEDWIHDIA